MLATRQQGTGGTTQDGADQSHWWENRKGRGPSKMGR